MICSRGGFESLEIWCKKNVFLSSEGTVTYYTAPEYCKLLQQWLVLDISVEKCNFHLWYHLP